MGKVIEKLRLTNVFDPKRTVEVEAVIDTGATMLVLPRSLVRKLKLRKMREAGVRYADSRTATKPVYGVVTAELKGRGGEFDVLAEDDGCQALVGQIVLEQLDLIVDPKKRRVVPNPQSPDLPMVEILALTRGRIGAKVDRGERLARGRREDKNPGSVPSNPDYESG